MRLRTQKQRDWPRTATAEMPQKSWLNAALCKSIAFLPSYLKYLKAYLSVRIQRKSYFAVVFMDMIDFRYYR